MSADAAQLEENLHLLGLSGKEQSCAILCGNQNISEIRDRFARQGLVSFFGQYEGRRILFVFSDGIFDGMPVLDGFVREKCDSVHISAVANSPQELIRNYHAMIRSVRIASSELQDQKSLIESDLVCELGRQMFDEAEKQTGCADKIVQNAMDLASQMPLNVFYPMLINHLEDLSARRYGEKANFSCKPTSLTSAEIGVNTILRNLELIISQKEKSFSATRFRQASAFIEKNFRSQIYLEDVAESMNLSVYSLSKLLNSNTQINFSDLIHICRIEEAKRLIREDCSFKQIAWQVGYRSQSYFSRNFKRIAGISPKEYKEAFVSYADQ